MADLNNMTLADVEVLNKEFGYELIIHDGLVVGASYVDDNNETKFIF